MTNIFTVYGSIFVFTLSISTAGCRETRKGHLEPIFSYGERHSVEVLKGFPQPEQFFREFVSREKPVLFKDAAKNFPAFNKWSDEFFISLPESKKHQVTVETKKKENRLQPADEVSFRTFLKYYHKKDIYMVESIPEFLRKDVLIPSCITCQSIIQKNLIQNVMWISSGGTQSVLHNDYAENINCVFKGSKQFYIVNRKYMDILNVTELGYSDVDVDSVDLNKYPGLYNMEHYKATVEAGDCLYIPFLWVHQVTSYHPNIAVNFWWKTKVDVNYNDCDTSGNITVNDVNFVGFDSLYEAQYGILKGRFKRRIRMHGPMTFEDLYDVVFEMIEVPGDEVNDENIKEVVKKIFLEVDSFPTDGVIMSDDVDNLSNENLKTIRNHLTTIIELLQQNQKELQEEEESGENEPPPDMPPPWVEWGESEPSLNVVMNEGFSKGSGDKITKLTEEMQWKQMVENRKNKREL